jgi:small-conductance mechanosensitive channel
MSRKPKITEWNFSFLKMPITEAKEPLGFNISASENQDSKIRRQEVNEMKMSRAKDLVFSQGKGIIMTFISSFFIGKNLSLFTIFIYGYQAFSAFTSIINVNNAFKRFESPEYSLITYKFAYVILYCISFLLIMYRIYGMGLVPLNPSDWVSLIDNTVPYSEFYDMK